MDWQLVSWLIQMYTHILPYTECIWPCCRACWFCIWPAYPCKINCEPKVFYMFGYETRESKFDAQQHANYSHRKNVKRLLFALVSKCDSNIVSRLSSGHVPGTVCTRVCLWHLNDMLLGDVRMLCVFWLVGWLHGFMYWKYGASIALYVSKHTNFMLIHVLFLGKQIAHRACESLFFGDGAAATACSCYSCWPIICRCFYVVILSPVFRSFLCIVLRSLPSNSHYRHAFLCVFVISLIRIFLFFFSRWLRMPVYLAEFHRLSRCFLFFLRQQRRVTYIEWSA